MVGLNDFINSLCFNNILLTYLFTFKDSSSMGNSNSVRGSSIDKEEISSYRGGGAGTNDEAVSESSNSNQNRNVIAPTNLAANFEV